MHATDRSGQITGTREDLARLGRCTVRQVDEALRDIQNTNTGNVTERNGIVTVTNRRMKREYLQRESVRLRVQKHRCNAHNQNHIPEPEEKKDRQLSQCHSGKMGEPLTKLTGEKLIGQASLNRVARDIISNKTGWAYDNCKVQPGMFPWPKSLVTVLNGFVDKVSESEVHLAWAEAVKRTHAASVDGFVRDPARYVIQCWKEALTPAT